MRTPSWLLAGLVAGQIAGLIAGPPTGPGTTDEAAPGAEPAAEPVVSLPPPPIEGRVQGRVRYAGKTPVRLKQFSNDVDPETCGRRVRAVSVEIGKRGSLANVHVEVRRSDGSPVSSRVLAPPPEPIPVALDRCTHRPHVLVVPVGSSVEIGEPDGILHELQSLPVHNPALDERLPRYRRRLVLGPEYFQQPERIRISCTRHGWASSYWLVSRNPHHALTNASGSYEVSGLPPGAYLVRAWHEEFGVLEEEILVETAEPVKLNLDFR